MNIVGAIIFFAWGVLFGVVVRKAYKKDDKDYSQYDTAVGTVIRTLDFCGERWIVDFKNAQGKQVLGMDNRLCASTFSTEKYHLPKRNTQEKVYYWKCNSSSRYRFSGREVDYYIHFCDETLYQLLDEKNRRREKVFALLGVIFALMGIMIFAFG